MKKLVPVLLLLTFSYFGFAQQVAKTIPSANAINGIIGFLEFKPGDYGTQKHPLIIFLHGVGERGNGTTDINLVTANAIPRFCAAGATMRFTYGGQTSSFVVLSPQLNTNYGSWPGFYVQEMLKYAKANLQIDTNRIYVTGLSLGGGGTWRAITNSLSDDYQFAAAAPVCGTQDFNVSLFCSTIGTSHLPVWAFHCMDDGTVPVQVAQYAQSLASACSPALSPAAKFTYYQSGGHSGAWLNAYDTGHITTIVNGGGSFTANPNMYEWFLSNTRSTVPNTAPIANAGNPQTITLPTNSVTLTGTGTDPVGTITGYSWKEVNGPSTVTITNSNAATAIVNGLTVGTYVFSLTVTDNMGASSSGTTTVVVNQAGVPIQRLGYIKLAAGVPQACSDTSRSGRIPVFGTSMAVGNILYTDSIGMSAYNGGWNWFSFSNTSNGAVAQAISILPTGGIRLLSACSITPPPPPPPPVVGGTPPLGYIKLSVGVPQACGDTSSAGRIPIYGSSLAVGNVLYSDSAHLLAFNGNWNWFSFSPAATGAATQALSIFPNGGIRLLSVCSGSTAPPPTASATPPLGYLKLEAGAPQACGDTASKGRFPVYGTSLATGSILYADSAKSLPYNGGWNWFSFSTATTGANTQALNILPDGSIRIVNLCSSVVRSVGGLSFADTLAATANKMFAIFPNPAHSNATIEWSHADAGSKMILLYNTNGILLHKYNWNTIEGYNKFSLNDVGGLATGIYIIDIRDNSGITIGKLKFIKM